MPVPKSQIAPIILPGGRGNFLWKSIANHISIHQLTLLPLNFDQGQFNFDAAGSEDGYRRWREELDTARRAFEKRWGVILSRRVLVVLQDHEKPLEGLLRLVSGSGKKSHAPPEFELCGLRFTPAMIQSIVQLDDAPPPAAADAG